MLLIKDEKNTEFSLIFLYIILTVFVSYFVGGRGEEVGTDTGNYLYYFNTLANQEKLNPDFDRIEIGFLWITKIISFFTLSPAVYLTIIFIIQFIGITGPFFKKSKFFNRYFLLSFLWLSYPFFYSITLNVLRQGIAFVFVIYAIDRYFCEERKRAYLLTFLGCAFHYVTIIYLFALLVEKLNIKTLLIMWWGSVILSITGGMSYVLKLLEMLLNIIGVNGYYLTYLDGGISDEYVIGFRLNFFLLSAAPITCIYLLKFFDFEISKNNFRLIKIYIAINSLYFLSTELPYSDRFAIASWLLIPYIVNDVIDKNIDYFLPLIAILPFFAIMLFYYELIGF